MRQKRELAAVLGIAPEKLRVLSYDVGGNFGTRNRVFVEFGLVLWAARKLGRPVKFTATRSEAFLSDYQGRDLVTKVELALRATAASSPCGRPISAMSAARCVSLSPLSKGAGLIPGSYDIPAATLRAMAVYTNTMPTQAYRSSGRPGGHVRDRAADRHRGRASSASTASSCGAGTWCGRRRCRTATRSA